MCKDDDERGSLIAIGLGLPKHVIGSTSDETLFYVMYNYDTEVKTYVFSGNSKDEVTDIIKGVRRMLHSAADKGSFD